MHETGQERVERVFGAAVDSVPSPMTPAALREVLRHEGGGLVELVVADKVDSGSELGSAALYVEHDAAATPVPNGHDGAQGADVDPLTVLGTVWGAQWVFEKAHLGFYLTLGSMGMIRPPDEDVSAWTAIMYAQHCIGFGGFKRLMKLGKARGLLHPIAVLDDFAHLTMPPKIGRMSGELVRERVHQMLTLPSIGAANRKPPTVIVPLGERPSGAPVFDAAKAKRYIIAERERVRAGRPHGPNGSPFGG